MEPVPRRSLSPFRFFSQQEETISRYSKYKMLFRLNVYLAVHNSNRFTGIIIKEDNL